MNWKDHRAAKLVSNEQLLDMMKNMYADNCTSKTSYMERYMQMPEELQCALGFMRCLFDSGYLGTYSAYGRFSMDALMRIPPMRLPLQFIGWAGMHNNIGPAYEMDANCYFYDHSRIFYTDDDIMYHAEEAKELANDIAAASSGIDEIRVEELECMQTMSTIEKEVRWCITFRLNENAKREIVIGGKTVCSGRNNASLFVLPKAGEFNCILGEIVDGVTDNCLILAKHNYCMK